MGFLLFGMSQAFQPIPSQGPVLIADDSPRNRAALRKVLEDIGMPVEEVGTGIAAMERVLQGGIDLLLLDTLMPGPSTEQILKQLRSSEDLQEIPVIVLAGPDDQNRVAECIGAGAEDFLPRPFRKEMLIARVRSSLQKRRLLEAEREAHKALEASRNHLAAELAEAAAYVEALIPKPLTQDPIQTDWRFVPSTQLGGDALGYHWLDAEHFAMYLLDVCGHGVGAALLSISAVNVVRSMSLPDTDFKDPGQVLAALNNTFQMENHNNMYFTMWYGVYHLPSRRLRHAKGGHPAPLLLRESEGSRSLTELACDGMLIGSLPDLPYPSQEVTVPHGARMYVFSDGVYEVHSSQGEMWGLEGLRDQLQGSDSLANELDCILSQARDWAGSAGLEDDFSILRVSFPD